MIRYSDAQINGHPRIRHVDANESMFIASALTEVEARLYERLEAPLLFRQLLTIGHDGPKVNGAAMVYEMVEHVGEAVWISTEQGGTRPTLANAKVTPYTTYVRRMGSAYQWSIDDEAATAAQLIGPRTDVMQQRAIASRKAVENKLNSAILLGNTALGLQGLFTHTAITPVDMITSTDYTGRWQLAATTTAEIQADVANMFSAYVQRVGRDDMPPAKFVYPLSLASVMTRIISGTSMTLRTFFAETYASTKFMAASQLNTAATTSGATGRVMLYNDDEMYVDGVIPEEFRQLPPEAHGFGWEVDTTALTAGCRYRYPVTGMYFDGVLQVAA